MLNTQRLDDIDGLLSTYPRTKKLLTTWAKRKMVDMQNSMASFAKELGGETPTIPEIGDEVVDKTLPLLIEQYYHLLFYFFDDNEVFISIHRDSDGFQWGVKENKETKDGWADSRFSAEKQSIKQAFEMLESKKGFV